LDAFAIDARNLTIENGIFDRQVFRDPGSEFCESAKHVSVARDQLAFAFRDVGQCPESVDLQFVQIFIRVERFGTAGKPYGAEVRQARHSTIIAALRDSLFRITDFTPTEKTSDS
jgi:hypothetical protein